MGTKEDDVAIRQQIIKKPAVFFVVIFAFKYIFHSMRL